MPQLAVGTALSDQSLARAHDEPARADRAGEPAHAASAHAAGPGGDARLATGLVELAMHFVRRSSSTQSRWARSS